MNLEGYETVAERIQRFYADHPNGSIRTESVEFITVAGKEYVLVKAMAFRDGEDYLPGIGHALDPAPGVNRFTAMSFLETAETSAWGRALASLGYSGQQIATKDEVEAVTTEVPETKVADEFIAWATRSKLQRDEIKLAMTAMGVSVGNKLPSTVVKTMTEDQVVALKERLESTKEAANAS